MDQFCTFPAIEKLKLFRLTLFNYLVGNEDMHLKNFSLIRRNSKIELSPAYDMINTSIVIGKPAEEIALPLDGRKRNLTRELLLEYLGRDRLELPQKVIQGVQEIFSERFADWERLLSVSFLSDGLKKRYAELVAERRAILGV